jgi:hypothetical protein
MRLAALGPGHESSRRGESPRCSSKTVVSFLPIRQRHDEQQVGDGLHLLAVPWLWRDLEPVAAADVSQTTVNGRAVPRAACYTGRVTLDPAEFVLPASVS